MTYLILFTNSFVVYVCDLLKPLEENTILAWKFCLIFYKMTRLQCTILYENLVKCVLKWYTCTFSFDIFVQLHSFFRQRKRGWRDVTSPSQLNLERKKGKHSHKQLFIGLFLYVQRSQSHNINFIFLNYFKNKQKHY